MHLEFGTMRRRLSAACITLWIGVSLLGGCNRQKAPAAASRPLPQLRDVVDLESFQITKTEEGQTRFLLKLRCKQAMKEKYRVLFHGYVKDNSIIPAEKQNKYKFLNADHEFAQPTDTWKQGEVVEHEVILELNPGEYNFHLGLFDRHNSTALPGGDFELGWIHMPPKD